MKILQTFTAFIVSASLGSATVTILAQESGSDVLFSWSGSLNLDALTLGGTASILTRTQPSRPDLFSTTGATSVDIDRYTGGPGLTSSYGSGSSTVATVRTGGVFAFFPAGGGVGIYVPTGYVSGNPFPVGSMTFSGTNLATLGVSTGGPVTVASWGSGPTADSIVLIASAAPVPEPSSVLLLGAASIGLLFRRRVS